MHPLEIYVGRRRTRDNMMTFDNVRRTHDNVGNAMGVPFEHTYRTHDGRTCDSSGAFLVGELERLDQTLHEPLAAVSWGRDIDLREDVTLADEVSSFTLSTYGAQGGLGTGNGIGNGKSWAGKNTDQVTGVGLDIAKIPNPLTIWMMELKYTIPELESAARAGRPIDQQKYAGMQLKHQMDIDEQVYIGDTSLAVTGLVNNTAVTNVGPVANGAIGSPLWTQKTPAEILQDVNEILVSAWTTSAYAIIPTRLLLPPQQFGYISTQLVSLAGNTSILKYIMENNLLTTSGKGKIDIYPCKWLVGAGAGGTVGTENGHDRMVAYTKEYDRIRFPMTVLQRTPIQYQSIYHQTTYFCRLGVVEVVYPETIAYRDGL
jgi:hypothetical protein